LGKSVKIYQIYYDEKSKKNCLEGFEPYFILKLFNTGKHRNSDYFGVFSHSFQHKIHIWPQSIYDAMEVNDYDVYSFFSLMSTNNIFLKGDNWHENFSTVCQKILNKIGFSGDIAHPDYTTRCIVYQNHFIARSEIYQDYVDTILRPAIEVMNTDEEIKEIIWKDARYHKSNKQEVRDRLKEEIGVEYYPYHPFVCERLFSFYLDLNPHITFKHLV
jgi:hypothetical protein